MKTKLSPFNINKLLARDEHPVTNMAEVHRAAESYVKHGLSVIPIVADGTKMPAFDVLMPIWSEEQDRHVRAWKGYRLRRPSRRELRDWFCNSDGVFGMAILGGAISGNLEIIDLDNMDVVGPWCELVERQRPGLLRRLVLVRTPRPGMHAYYRCPVIGGNQKLARVPDPEHGGKKPKTIIEVKSEGGYCLAPGSPGECHSTGRSYTIVSNHDFTQIQTITSEDRDVLLTCARQLNCWAPPTRAPLQRATGRVGGRPGDDFNARVTWADILTPHGWTLMTNGDEGSEHWCRPGKSFGTSAAAYFCGTDLLYVFSSNADPFEDQRPYTKFAAYALLEHDGNFTAAARALRARGYGSRARHRLSPYRGPFAKYSNCPRLS